MGKMILKESILGSGEIGLETERNIWTKIIMEAKYYLCLLYTSVVDNINYLLIFSRNLMVIEC